MSEKEELEAAFDLMLTSINFILAERGICFRLGPKGEVNYPTIQLLNRYLDFLMKDRQGND